MIQIFKKKNGAVSVFLTIILVPVLVVCFLFVDASRTRLAQGVVSSAGDLTMNTVLTQYDSTLNDYYGMLASCQDIDTFLSTADDYFTACITSQGIEPSEARKYADLISGVLEGEDTEIVDFLQISKVEDTKFTVSAVKNGTLENPALVKKEIVEFMKYRAPIDGIAEIIELFQKSSSDLEDSADNADLVDKKQKFYESENELNEKAKEAYDKLKEYSEQEITKEEIDQMKQTLDSLESNYKNIHIKMVKDLYNTQGLQKFEASDLYLNYVTAASDVNTKQINGYIQNAANSMNQFVSAAKNLDNAYSTMPEYQTGIVYDIQYWVACNEVLQQNSYYTDYVSAAKSLNKNMANLKTAMEGLGDEEKSESYILKKYSNVNAGGEKTRQEHYDSLFSQYETLKKNYLQNTYSAYSQITENLSQISSAHLNDIDTSGTDTQIREIQAQLETYYTKYDDACNQVTSAVKTLTELKKLVTEYKAALNTWSNAADSYTTSMAKSDQKEIDELGDDFLKNLSEDKVQELIDRLNNIKSLLGSLKSGIDEYSYNGTKVRDIGSYEKMKQVSGVDKSKISYLANALNTYAEQSFKFAKSSTLQSVGITNNNNPAISQVNVPDAYTWIMSKFKDYDQKEMDKYQKEYDNSKEKYNDLYKDADEPNIISGAELKDQDNRPSEKYAEDKKEGLVSNDVSKISGVVSGLFKDFTGTVGQTLVNLRDDLYAMDYIMNMFSYDTYELEAKYRLCDGDVDLTNYKEKYTSSEIEEKWKSTDLQVTVNKTLTNKMISSDNNYSYGNEVEYILYGGSNAQNKTSSYGTIFAIRFALNLAPEFSHFWIRNEFEDSQVLDDMAIAVELGSSGIIPAHLFKLVVILGLTAAESAADLNYLKHGMPIDLVKDAKDLEISYSSDKITGASEKKRQVSDYAFFYSDYLKLILFLKLSLGEENAIYARTADVIQANMNYKISADTGFSMENAIVYFSGEATVQVEPLMLQLPIASDYSGQLSQDGGWNFIKYNTIRGY